MKHVTGLIGRDDLIEQVAREARKGRHLLLTGRPGIGKSTVLEAVLDRLIVRRELIVLHVTRASGQGPVSGNGARPAGKRAAETLGAGAGRRPRRPRPRRAGMGQAQAPGQPAQHPRPDRRHRPGPPRPPGPGAGRGGRSDRRHAHPGGVLAGGAGRRPTARLRQREAQERGPAVVEAGRDRSAALAHRARAGDRPDLPEPDRHPGGIPGAVRGPRGSAGQRQPAGPGRPAGRQRERAGGGQGADSRAAPRGRGALLRLHPGDDRGAGLGDRRALSGHRHRRHRAVHLRRDAGGGGHLVRVFLFRGAGRAN